MLFFHARSWAYDLGIADMPMKGAFCSGGWSTTSNVVFASTCSWSHCRMGGSQVEAGICIALMRTLHGDSTHHDGRELRRFLAEQCQRHPSKDLHDSGARHDTSKFLAEDLATHFRKKAPACANHDSWVPDSRMIWSVMPLSSLFQESRRQAWHLNNCKCVITRIKAFASRGARRYGTTLTKTF